MYPAAAAEKCPSLVQSYTSLRNDAAAQFCLPKTTTAVVKNSVKSDVGKVQSLLLRTLPVDKLWQRLRSLQKRHESSANSLAKEIINKIVRRKELKWINDKEREEAAASVEAMHGCAAWLFRPLRLKLPEPWLLRPENTRLLRPSR
eukprot:s1830_g20.t1